MMMTGTEMGTTMIELEMRMHLESWLVCLHFYILFALLSNTYKGTMGVRKWEPRQRTLSFQHRELCCWSFNYRCDRLNLFLKFICDACWANAVTFVSPFFYSLRFSNLINNLFCNCFHITLTFSLLTSTAIYIR